MGIRRGLASFTKFLFPHLANVVVGRLHGKLRLTGLGRPNEDLAVKTCRRHLRGCEDRLKGRVCVRL